MLFSFLHNPLPLKSSFPLYMWALRLGRKGVNSSSTASLLQDGDYDLHLGFFRIVFVGKFCLLYNEGSILVISSMEQGLTEK